MNVAYIICHLYLLGQCALTLKYATNFQYSKAIHLISCLLHLKLWQNDRGQCQRKPKEKPNGQVPFFFYHKSFFVIKSRVLYYSVTKRHSCTLQYL